MLKILTLLSVMLCLDSCSNVQIQPVPQAQPATPPVVSTPVVIPPPAPVAPAIPAPPVATANISALVSNTQCAQYQWLNRGQAPSAYILGVAQAYARSLCRLKSGPGTPADTMSKVLGGSEDALKWYAIAASNVPSERLKQTYTLLLGLGMRESSGNFGCGRDMTVTNPTAVNAETGAFQVSYDNNNAGPAMNQLYLEYQAYPANCGKILDINIDQGWVGTGPGLAFQQFMRSCPLLQAEYAAAGIRVDRPQWGPLDRKQAEYRPECYDMFTTVENAVSCK